MPPMAAPDSASRFELRTFREATFREEATRETFSLYLAGEAAPPPPLPPLHTCHTA